MIVIGFTILISAFNVVIFVLRTLAMAKNITNVPCPNVWGEAGLGLAFGFGSLLSHLDKPSTLLWKTSLILTQSLIPIFIWVSDAFLVSQLSLEAGNPALMQMWR